MHLRAALLAFAVALCLWVPVPATTKLMPIDEIRPGMVGVGRTVFEGAELQEFKVHVLGVLRNIQGPRRDLILARLEGGPLAETGVAQGMSGSPVYIEGRLAGAVSYSIGAFPKEAIAGITPIAEMMDATRMARRPPSAQARIELPITPESLAAALRASHARLAPFAARPADVQAIGLPAAAGGSLATMLRPITTPLVMTGFEPEAVDLLAGAFRQAGFAPVAGGTLSGHLGDEARQALAGPLREGDAVGVTLVGGDFEMGATGTVTHIDGDRVYAFGHPFFNLGPTAFPMTRAYVYTMLPSLMTSFKIASMGDVIGTVQQDRATAIAGTLGPAPRLIPVKITLQSDRDGATISREFTYEVVNDQTFTSLLAYVAMFNTIIAHERQLGVATFTVDSRTKIQGHADVTVQDVFSGDTASTGVATAVAGPLTMLMANDHEPVTIEGLDITLNASEVPRVVTIERIWLDEIRPRAGRTVPLKILTRSYRGEERISTMPIDLPAHLSGPLTIVVSDGQQLTALEQRELRRSMQPDSVTQLIRALNQTRRNNRIYVRLLTGAPGAVVNGEPMPSLPPSVLSVFEGNRHGGSYAPIRRAPVGEWELAIDSAVRGSRTLALEVDPRAPAGR